MSTKQIRQDNKMYIRVIVVHIFDCDYKLSLLQIKILYVFCLNRIFLVLKKCLDNS